MNGVIAWTVVAGRCLDVPVSTHIRYQVKAVIIQCNRVLERENPFTTEVRNSTGSTDGVIREYRAIDVRIRIVDVDYLGLQWWDREGCVGGCC